MGSCTGTGGRPGARGSRRPRRLKVGARPVHLVDERQARYVEIVGLVPHRFRLWLDARDAAEHHHRAVEHAQRALDLDGEVHVPRRIDEVHIVARAIPGWWPRRPGVSRSRKRVAPGRQFPRASPGLHQQDGLPGRGFSGRCDEIRERLAARPVPVQLPIGAEDQFTGVVDLIRERAIYFSGGEDDPPREDNVPAAMADAVAAAREKPIDG